MHDIWQKLNIFLNSFVYQQNEIQLAFLLGKALTNVLHL